MNFLRRVSVLILLLLFRPRKERGERREDARYRIKGCSVHSKFFKLAVALRPNTLLYAACLATRRIPISLQNIHS